MGDFPSNWTRIRDLTEGGQAHTFLVRRAHGSDPGNYVLKRLKNPKRRDYFEREIRGCMELDHPNILKVLEHGQTPKGLPFLITEFCEGGSLEANKPVFDGPGDGLRFFGQIVEGMVHAHTHSPPVSHLDLKPANILLQNGRPLIGDFGICFIADDEVSMTSEGFRGSQYYCAPELRNPKLGPDPKPTAADVYSLGKLLYWLFTGDVYDGHDEEYYEVRSRRLATLFPAQPQYAFVDELISETVQRNTSKRLANASVLQGDAQAILERIEAGGRVLDLRILQRCLFCGKGNYKPVTMPPTVEARSSPRDQSPLPYQGGDIYSEMRRGTNMTVGQAFAGSGGVNQPVPINLICDFCGNLQSFRIDRIQAALKNWLP